MRSSYLAIGVILAAHAAGAGVPASASASCVNPGGTGGCFSSVQAAVDAAGLREVVDVAPGTYFENVTIGPGSRLTLVGAGTSTILDGGAVGAVIRIAGPRTRVTLEGMTIRNGSDSGVTADRSRVKIVGCLITENTGEIGGGIGDFGEGRARFEIVESSIVDNAATFNGGGISVLGPSSATLVRSTVSGNAGMQGGGISAANARLVLESSTVSGNTASTGGGVQGGGLVRGVVRIRNSTIAGNTAIGSGGGLRMVGGRAIVGATILAQNSAPTGPDCYVPEGPMASRGFNLLGDPSDCDVRGRTSLDLNGVDPLLGPLQNNGGPTETHALLAGSPALGAIGNPRLCAEPDQRGEPRTIPCDIGAFEAP